MKKKWVKISLVVLLAIVISVSAVYAVKYNAVSVNIAGTDNE